MCDGGSVTACACVCERAGAVFIDSGFACVGNDGRDGASLLQRTYVRCQADARGPHGDRRRRSRDGVRVVHDVPRDERYPTWRADSVAESRESLIEQGHASVEGDAFIV
jgi:hypothetical protein